MTIENAEGSTSTLRRAARFRIVIADAPRSFECQIASKSDPFSLARVTPSEGAKTGVAEPYIAEQSRSWQGRVASGGLSAVLEAPAVVAGLDDQRFRHTGFLGRPVSRRRRNTSPAPSARLTLGERFCVHHTLG